MVSAAFLLMDLDTRKEIETYYTLVFPDGWEITAENAAIHGITHEMASMYGVPEADVVEKFKTMQDASVLRVAHNQDFDTLLLRMGMLRYGMTRQDADERCYRPNACTMQMATPVLNLPPTERMLERGVHSPKTASLQECVKFFFNEEHEGAHDALADARACARVYFRLLEILHKKD